MKDLYIMDTILKRCSAFVVRAAWFITALAATMWCAALVVLTYSLVGLVASSGLLLQGLILETLHNMLFYTAVISPVAACFFSIPARSRDVKSLDDLLLHIKKLHEIFVMANLFAFIMRIARMLEREVQADS